MHGNCIVRINTEAQVDVYVATNSARSERGPSWAINLSWVLSTLIFPSPSKYIRTNVALGFRFPLRNQGTPEILMFLLLYILTRSNLFHVAMSRGIGPYSTN
jgi:hypothetical protein